MGRALVMKARDCGFESHSGQFSETSSLPECLHLPCFALIFVHVTVYYCRKGSSYRQLSAILNYSLLKKNSIREMCHLLSVRGSGGV